jgi:hypothetical protein
LHSQLVAQQQLETEEKARLDQSQAQFTAALAASRFNDRQAFLAALLDDETASLQGGDVRVRPLRTQRQVRLLLPGRLLAERRRLLAAQAGRREPSASAGAGAADCRGGAAGG